MCESGQLGCETAASANAASTRRTRPEAWGGAQAAERTVNMSLMSVTLDVSKFTGWLKATASCRVESSTKAVHAMPGEVCGPEGAGARTWGSGSTSGAHAERTRDCGG